MIIDKMHAAVPHKKVGYRAYNSV